MTYSYTCPQEQANVESQKTSRLTKLKKNLRQLPLTVILKSHRFTAPLAALCTLALSSLTAADTVCCDGTALADMQPDSLLSPETKKKPRTKRTPVCVTVSASGQQQSVLDWFRLEKPWQTKRIMLQFLATVACSKWIPTSKHTRRTSRGGKLQLKQRFCA